MAKPKYEKPVVIRQGYSPEAVESGCCLTSCGGSPGGMQAGRHLHKKETDKITEILKNKTKE